MQGFLYYVGFTKEEAESLPFVLYRLSRPKSIAESAGDVLCAAFPSIRHPERDEWMFVINGETLPIHQLAYTYIVDGEEEVMGYLEAMYPDQEERDAVINVIKHAHENKQRLPASAFVPVAWASKLRTLEEIEADGWFPFQGEV